MYFEKEKFRLNTTFLTEACALECTSVNFHHNAESERLSIEFCTHKYLQHTALTPILKSFQLLCKFRPHKAAFVYFICSGPQFLCQGNGLHFAGLKIFLRKNHSLIRSIMEFIDWVRFPHFHFRTFVYSARSIRHFLIRIFQRFYYCRSSISSSESLYQVY